MTEKDCPECDGKMTQSGGVWTCQKCGHTMKVEEKEMASADKEV